MTEKQAEKIIDLLDQIGSLLGDIRNRMSENTAQIEQSIERLGKDVINAVYEAARESA